MALLAKQIAAMTGTVVTMAAATGGGDTLAPDDHGVLLVTNGSGGSITVTVAVPGLTKYSQNQPDVAVAIAAGVTKEIGPFPADLADPADNLVHITYSGVTSLTVGYLTH